MIHMSSEEFMLTTVDNPYDPFTEFEEWYSFDQAKGYYTPEYLGNLARTSIELSDEDYELEVQHAIDEIVKNDPLGIRIKVKKGDVKRMNRST